MLLSLTIAALLLVGTGTGLAGLTAVTAVQVLSTGLPDPVRLASLDFDQPTIAYDRTGTIELGRFEREKRRVVEYTEIPTVILDATTTADDRTFWENDGFDLGAILSAAADSAAGADERVASTITQQLVRARLLQPKAEVGPEPWRADVADWLRRARRGPGVAGPYDSRTAYFRGQRTWGGPLAGPCPPPPTPTPPPAPAEPPGQGGELAGQGAEPPGHGGDEPGGGPPPEP